MDNELSEPNTPFDQSAALVEQDSAAHANFLDDSFSETCCLRHDGWDGPESARFSEPPAKPESPLCKTRDTINFINFARRSIRGTVRERKASCGTQVCSN